MYLLVWEYLVKTDRVTEFEEIYSASGTWALLFQKHPGYLDSSLLRDSNLPQRYIIIDRWVSSEAYNSFQQKWQAEYKELDARCEDLTDHEAFLGSFSPAQPGG